VVADPRRLTRFFFDRNLGHRVPEALRADGWLVEMHDDHFAEDTPDEVILEAVASSDWVLVTQDRRIRKRAAELEALIERGVRAFFIASTANLSAAETTDVLRRAHAAMVTALDALEAPFVVAIYKDASTRRIV
jgi:predicted nuclease of predicted toxin-antitoxin system